MKNMFFAFLILSSFSSCINHREKATGMTPEAALLACKKDMALLERPENSQSTAYGDWVALVKHVSSVSDSVLFTAYILKDNEGSNVQYKQVLTDICATRIFERLESIDTVYITPLFITAHMKMRTQSELAEDLCGRTGFQYRAVIALRYPLEIQDKLLAYCDNVSLALRMKGIEAVKENITAERYSLELLEFYVRNNNYTDSNFCKEVIAVIPDSTIVDSDFLLKQIPKARAQRLMRNASDLKTVGAIYLNTQVGLQTFQWYLQQASLNDLLEWVESTHDADFNLLVNLEIIRKVRTEKEYVQVANYFQNDVGYLELLRKKANI